MVQIDAICDIIHLVVKKKEKDLLDSPNSLYFQLYKTLEEVSFSGISF